MNKSAQLFALLFCGATASFDLDEVMTDVVSIVKALPADERDFSEIYKAVKAVIAHVKSDVQNKDQFGQILKDAMIAFSKHIQKPEYFAGNITKDLVPIEKTIEDIIRMFAEKAVRQGIEFSSAQEFQKSFASFVASKSKREHKFQFGHIPYAPNHGLRDSLVGDYLSTYRADGDALPKELDLRKEGLVTGVKDQALCGSCWSFATAGAMEGRAAKLGLVDKYDYNAALKDWVPSADTFSISEEQIIDHVGDEGNNGVEGCQGCGGGNAVWGFQYLAENSFNGACSLHDYKYTSGRRSGECQETRGADGCFKKNHMKTCTPVITQDQFEDQKVLQLNCNGVDATNCLKHGLMTNGPAAIGGPIQDDNWMNFMSTRHEELPEGNWPIAQASDFICTPENPGPCHGSGHAILLVGWGNENGQEYWIIKNSWAEEWGHNGYLHLATGQLDEALVSQDMHGFQPMWPNLKPGSSPPTDKCKDVTCDDGQTCVDGQCVTPKHPAKCDPTECKAQGGHCKNGKCVKPHEPPAPSGKGIPCDKASIDNPYMKPDDYCFEKSNYQALDAKCVNDVCVFSKPAKKKENGESCSVASDCKSGFCNAEGKCADKHNPPSGHKHANGDSCSENADCQSNFCNQDGKCAANPVDPPAGDLNFSSCGQIVSDGSSSVEISNLKSCFGNITEYLEQKLLPSSMW